MVMYPPRFGDVIRRVVAVIVSVPQQSNPVDRIRHFVKYMSQEPRGPLFSTIGSYRLPGGFCLVVDAMNNHNAIHMSD